MADQQKDPQLKFPTNTPVTVTGLGFLKEGENNYGPWYLYKGNVDGKPHTFFATDKLHGILKEYPNGSSVVINKKEEQGEQGTYSRWMVNPAVFDGQGNAPPPPKANPTPEGIATDARLMAKCFGEAVQIAQTHNDWLGANGGSSELKMNHEDVTKIALSIFIKNTK